MHPAIRILFGAALLPAGLAACSNSNGSSASTTTTAASAAAPAKTKTTKVMASSNGLAVYTTNCSTCHQSDGKGAIGPPLAGNPVVTGDAGKVIHIVNGGLTGTISVNGKTFNGTMPAWKGTLSTGDIAAVITYIRSSWGNKAGPVTSAQVASTP
jgi:mono/diheme cytochrome c family protein